MTTTVIVTSSFHIYAPCILSLSNMETVRVNYKLRAPSYEPGYQDGSVTGMNFVVCSYGKSQPGYQDGLVTGMAWLSG